jgi:hypothetical protein
MAIHTNLPIYKVTYDLFSLVTQITRNMPRDVKASVGGKVRDECVELLVLIYRANSSKDKVPHLAALLERLQVTELLLRLSRDMHFISTSQYARAVQLTDSIGKQASGWRKHSASSPAA